VSAQRNAGQASLTSGIPAYALSVRNRFSIPDAGRSLSDAALHLQPLPLIGEHGAIKVALASGSGAPQNPELALA
jgi:hypothetical protein